MRLVQVTHIWLVSTESVAVEIIVLNHMEPEPVVSADVKFRTMSLYLKTVHKTPGFYALWYAM